MLANKKDDYDASMLSCYSLYYTNLGTLSCFSYIVFFFLFIFCPFIFSSLLQLTLDFGEQGRKTYNQ